MNWAISLCSSRRILVSGLLFGLYFSLGRCIEQSMFFGTRHVSIMFSCLKNVESVLIFIWFHLVGWGVVWIEKFGSVQNEYS